jgi:hypothetical protein
MGTVLS